MSKDRITKDHPVIAAASVGTALGTCTGVIDTSAWNSMQVNCIHGGTGGSRTVNVYINAGTRQGTLATTFPEALSAASKTSDYAGLGNPVFVCGSLTDQAIITYGTSTNLGFTISYLGLDL